jgi:hypothetical protein
MLREFSSGPFYCRQQNPFGSSVLDVVKTVPASPELRIRHAEGGAWGVCDPHTQNGLWIRAYLQYETIRSVTPDFERRLAHGAEMLKDVQQKAKAIFCHWLHLAAPPGIEAERRSEAMTSCASSIATRVRITLSRSVSIGR